MLSELARTIVAAQSAPPAPPAPTELKAARDRLNAIDEALHQPIGGLGETPFSALSRQARYIGLGAQPPSLATDRLVEMGRPQEDALAAVLAEYGELIASEDGGRHPFEGTRNIQLQPVELARLAPMLDAAASGAGGLATAIKAALTATGCELPVSPRTAERLGDLLDRLKNMPAGAGELAKAMLDAPDAERLNQDLQAGQVWRDAHQLATTTFTEPALATAPPATRAALLAGTTSFFARWGGAYRQASRELAALLTAPLPRTAQERVEQVDQLVQLGALRREWEDDREYCSRVLGDDWRGERTDFARLQAVAQWCARLRGSDLARDRAALTGLGGRSEELASLTGELAKAREHFAQTAEAATRMLDLDPEALPGGSLAEADLDALQGRFEGMARLSDRYATWALLERLRRNLEEEGLGELADRMRAGGIDGNAAVTELRFARAEVHV